MDIRELELRTKTSNELQELINELEFKITRPYRSDKQRELLNKQVKSMKALQITAQIRKLMCKANHPSRSSAQRIELREEIQRLQNLREGK